MNSLTPDYFDRLYQTDPDPWKFETSPYESEKYATTMAALTKPRYRSGFEIGGSIGVLTEKLADRCESLLSIDVVPAAQQKAIDRCRHLPQVQFKLMQLPEEYPQESFDLVILSEVGYYWTKADLLQARTKIVESLEPGGQLLLVHWTPIVETNPLTGDQVHELFLELVPDRLRSLASQRAEQYRLDLLEKSQ